MTSDWTAIASFVGLGVLLVVVVVGTVLAVRMTLAGRRARLSPWSRRFAVDSDELRLLTVDVIRELKGKIDRNDDVISFSTGLSRFSWEGQTVELRVVPDGEASMLEVEAAYPNPTGQIHDWHEGDVIVQRLFAGVESRITARQSGRSEAPPTSP